MIDCVLIRIALTVLFIIQGSIFAEAEWFQFLGPNRDGTSNDDAVAKRWVGGELSQQWRVPVGEGYSGVVIKGDSLFTMDSNGKDEFVISLKAADGKERWRVRTGSSPRDVYGGYGPRVTPSIDNELFITVSAQGTLIALNTDSGRIEWQRQLAQELGWRPPAEGTSCSPLVRDGRIYLIVGGAGGKAVAAFDRDTGKTIWTSQDDQTSYSSPTRWNFENTQQALFLTGSNLFSVDAASGKLLWKYSWPTYDSVNVTTPILIPPDRVFISSGYDQGSVMLRVRNNKGNLNVEEVWRNREMKNHFNNSVYHSGVLYGFDNAILKAIDAQTGKTLWRESGFGNGSLILVGAYLIILSESGELSIAKTSNKVLTVEKRLQVLKGKNWTPPSISGNRIYLRNQNEVVCLGGSR